MGKLKAKHIAKSLFVSSLSLLISSCLSSSFEATTTPLIVSAVNVANNILTITGSGLNQVTGVNIPSMSAFSITSQDASMITAVPLSSIALAVGTSYNLALASETTQSATTITFTLPNPMTLPANSLNVGSGELITSAGNVGIGTATPGNLLTISGTDSSLIGGPHIEIFSSLDSSYPMYHQVNWSHDNISLNFDAFFNGAWTSSSATNNFQIIKHQGTLNFNYATAVPAGAGIGWQTGIEMDGAGHLGVNMSAPQATLDVGGYARLVKYNAQPVACAAGNDGAIALTHVYTLCICDGGTTTWVQSKDGTTACAW